MDRRIMDNVDNLDRILEEIMLGIYSRVISHEEKLLKSLSDLSLKEFNTLNAIANTTKNKTNTANNIAKILDITPGTLTTNLDRLSDKGYVIKEKNSEDKRIVQVFLTPSGIAIRKKRENAHKKIINSAIDKLSTSEKVALVTALNKLDI